MAELATLLGNLIGDDVPIDRIGAQGEFGAQPPPIQVLSDRLDQLASFNLPLLVTGFDMTTADDQLQLDFTRDFLTLAFSHPSVEGFFFSRFWGDDEEPAGVEMYHADGTITPIGKAYRELVLENWWTDIVALSNAEGTLTSRVFQGDYLVSARKDDLRATATLSLGPDGAKSLWNWPQETKATVRSDIPANGYRALVGELGEERIDRTLPAGFEGRKLGFSRRMATVDYAFQIGQELPLVLRRPILLIARPKTVAGDVEHRTRKIENRAPSKRRCKAGARHVIAKLLVLLDGPVLHEIEGRHPDWTDGRARQPRSRAGAQSERQGPPSAPRISRKRFMRTSGNSVVR